VNQKTYQTMNDRLYLLYNIFTNGIKYIHRSPPCSPSFEGY